MFHPRLARVGKYRFEIENPESYRGDGLRSLRELHVLHVPHGKASRVFREERDGTLIGEGGPVQVELEVNERRIRFTHQDVVADGSAVDRRELGGMIVVGESDSRSPALRAPAVELRRALLPRVNSASPREGI